MTPRRVVAKVEWHPGELYPRVGFIVTNMTRPAERVVAFYNQRGTAEQWIKEGKNTVKWTRPSCCPLPPTPSGFSFMRWPTISPTSLGRPLDRQIARPRTHFCRNRRHLRRGLGCNGRKASVSSGRVPCSSSKSGPTSFA